MNPDKTVSNSTLTVYHPTCSSPVFFSSKVSCFYDRLNSLLLVIEPVLFITYRFVVDFGVKEGDLAGIGREKPHCSSCVCHYFFQWLPKSRNMMTIPIQRSHSRIILLLWCGFCLLIKETVGDGKRRESRVCLLLCATEHLPAVQLYTISSELCQRASQRPFQRTIIG